jgi:hypothetical protein
MYEYIHIYMNIYIYMNIFIYIFIYKCIHTYINRWWSHSMAYGICIISVIFGIYCWKYGIGLENCVRRPSHFDCGMFICKHSIYKYLCTNISSTYLTVELYIYIFIYSYMYTYIPKYMYICSYRLSASGPTTLLMIHPKGI